MTAQSVSYRDATPDDLPVLERAILAAMNWRDGTVFTLEQIRLMPEIWHYVDGWQLPKDFGVIALEGDLPIGAVWARLLPASDAGFGYVSDDIPELSMGVEGGHRGAGVGRALLERLIADASGRRLPSLSLSVEDGNTRARRLYESLGFTVAGRLGGSDTMLLRLGAS